MSTKIGIEKGQQKNPFLKSIYGVSKKNVLVQFGFNWISYLYRVFWAFGEVLDVLGYQDGAVLDSGVT